MTNSNTYIIDYAKLVKLLTPPLLRRPKLLAYLSILIAPIVALYQSFLLFRKAKLYQLAITPQVCYLEKMLNDRFDFTNRGIYIEDGADKPSTYLYRRAEIKPLILKKRTEAAPHIFYTRGETSIFVNDFVVYVPSAVVFDNAEMRTMIIANKLLGTKFKIQTY